MLKSSQVNNFFFFRFFKSYEPLKMGSRVIDYFKHMCETILCIAMEIQYRKIRFVVLTQHCFVIMIIFFSNEFINIFLSMKSNINL